MLGQSKAIYYHNPANGRSIDMLVLVPVTPGPGRGALLTQHCCGPEPGRVGGPAPACDARKKQASPPSPRELALR